MLRGIKRRAEELASAPEEASRKEDGALTPTGDLQGAITTNRGSHQWVTLR
jgi:hypothetical protein